MLLDEHKNAAELFSFVSVRQQCNISSYHWLAAALGPGCYCSGKRHILDLLNFGGRWQNCVLSHGVTASWPLFATVTRVSRKVATLCILKYETFFNFLLCKYCTFRHASEVIQYAFICHVLLFFNVDHSSVVRRLKGACGGLSIEENVLLILLNLLGQRGVAFQKSSCFTPIYIISKWQSVMHSFVRRRAFRPKKTLPYLWWLRRVMW